MNGRRSAGVPPVDVLSIRCAAKGQRPRSGRFWAPVNVLMRPSVSKGHIGIVRRGRSGLVLQELRRDPSPGCGPVIDTLLVCRMVPPSPVQCRCSDCRAYHLLRPLVRSHASMATIISHAALPLAIGFGLGRKYIPRRLMFTGVAASMFPDADVIFFRFGATYDTIWAHRGFTHSIGFAIVMGVAAAFFLRRAARPIIVFAFVALAGFSHGLLDMLTDGGHGIAILWPATAQRYFFEWRPIAVSPLAAGRFIHRALRIAQSEFLWIWIPAGVVALGLRASRHHQGAIS